MIEIKDKAFKQFVYFPKSIDVNYDSYDLVLHSEITQRNHEFIGLTDFSKSKKYFKFEIEFGDMDDGEYNYNISNISTGLIRIGEVTDDLPERYNYAPLNCCCDEIIEYYPNGNFKYKFQDKEIYIYENGSYDVKADSGYTAINKVIVNVSTSGHSDEELEEAYNSGYTDGTEDQKAKLISLDVDDNGTYSREDGYNVVNVNVPVWDYYDSGYTDGFYEGEEFQKSKLIPIDIDDNGTYSREDGYSIINVNVPVQDYYNSGYTDGYQDGYDDGYDEGYNSGWTEGYISGYTDGYEAATSACVIGYHTLKVDVDCDDTTLLPDLSGKVNVTVKYGDESETKTYEGSPVEFIILPGLDYYITFNDVDDFIKPDTLSGVSYWNGSSNEIGYYIYNPDFSKQYLTIEITEGLEGNNNVIRLEASTSGLGKEVQVKVNGGDWITKSFKSGSTQDKLITGLTVGDKIKIKGTNESYNGCVIKGNTELFADVYGNILSLIYGDDFKDKTTLPPVGYNFAGMFNNDNNGLKIINANNLILTPVTLKDGSYYKMFYNCTSLVTAPIIQATVMSSNSCEMMFQGCTSLVTAPELPATTLVGRCYAYMFKGCTSLVNAPELPATNVKGMCYLEMFNGCTSLTTAPELPATTIDNYCYAYMFQGCTSLVNVPSILPSTTLKLACYCYMFKGCRNLVNAPELPAETLVQECYFQMFYGCSSLKYIKCLATNISATNCTGTWVINVPSGGTFVKNASMSGWTTGVSGIPSGWNVEDAN